jgi:hypothetical protein
VQARFSGAYIKICPPECKAPARRHHEENGSQAPRHEPVGAKRSARRPGSGFSPFVIPDHVEVSVEGGEAVVTPSAADRVVARSDARNFSVRRQRTKRATVRIEQLLMKGWATPPDRPEPAVRTYILPQESYTCCKIEPRAAVRSPVRQNLPVPEHRLWPCTESRSCTKSQEPAQIVAGACDLISHVASTIEV